MNKILIVTLFFTFGCGGLTKPTYKKYDTAAEVTNPSVEAALASYKTNMAAIQTSCSCHTAGGTSAGGGKLSATDEAANRKLLLSYTGSTSTKLDELLRMTSATKKHGGGAVAVPTKVQIDTWLAAEAKVTP
jgi:hypothetical protein